MDGAVLLCNLEIMAAQEKVLGSQNEICNCNIILVVCSLMEAGNEAMFVS